MDDFGKLNIMLISASAALCRDAGGDHCGRLPISRAEPTGIAPVDRAPLGKVTRWQALAEAGSSLALRDQADANRRDRPAGRRCRRSRDELEVLGMAAGQRQLIPRLLGEARRQRAGTVRNARLRPRQAGGQRTSPAAVDPAQRERQRPERLHQRAPDMAAISKIATGTADRFGQAEVAQGGGIGREIERSSIHTTAALRAGWARAPGAGSGD